MVGDPSPKEARAFFEERLLPTIPDHLTPLQFEPLFEVFGGKLAHLGDYVADYSGSYAVLSDRKANSTLSVNSEGTLPLKESSHYLQAYTLLNLHLIHSAPSGKEDEASGQGFHIHSPIATASDSESSFIENGPAQFSSKELMHVMKTLKEASYVGLAISRIEYTVSSVDQVPWTANYFDMCRELGPTIIDGMIRGRILELVIPHPQSVFDGCSFVETALDSEHNTRGRPSEWQEAKLSRPRNQTNYSSYSIRNVSSVERIVVRKK